PRVVERRIKTWIDDALDRRMNCKPRRNFSAICDLQRGFIRGVLQAAGAAELVARVCPCHHGAEFILIPPWEQSQIMQARTVGKIERIDVVAGNAVARE